MNLPEDEKLAKGIKNNCEQSFKLLFDKYHFPLYSLALKYVKDEGLAEDAVQDVFLTLWNKRETLNPSLSVKGFLFTSLKNHVLNMVRNRKRRILSNIELARQKEYSVRNTEHTVYLNECNQIVQKGLQKLSPGKRQVFYLRRLRGFSNNEVAEELHVSIHTVKSQLYQATKYMRSFLKENINI